MIIGVCGFIGSGKNTVADYLVREHCFVPVSFASVLKDTCASLFGWDREMLEGRSEESRIQREIIDEFWSERLGIPNFSPRYGLQYIGTDIMRKHFHPDIWVIASERVLMRYRDVVISDVRFPNEIKSIQKMNGKIVLVKRGPNPEWYDLALNHNRNSSLPKPDVHYSEWAWIGCALDHTIENDGTMKDLSNKVENMIDTIFNK